MQNRFILFPRNSIRSSFQVVLLLLISCTILLSFYFLNQIEELQANMSDIIEKRQKLNNYCLKIDGTLNRAIYLHQNFIITRSNIIREKTEAIWENELVVYVDTLTNLSNAASDDPELLIRVQDMRKDINKLQGSLENMTKTNPANKIKLEIIDKEMKALLERVHQELMQIANLEENRIFDAGYSQRKQLRNLFILFAGFSGFLLFVFVIFIINTLQRIRKTARYINQNTIEITNGHIPDNLTPKLYELNELIEGENEIIERFRRLKRLAEDIGAGNLDTEIKVVDGRGEIGAAVTGMRNNLKHISIENWERNWINEGINKFTNILRNDTENTRAFYEHIISNIVNYLDINQGGIFILNEDESQEKPERPPFMELKAVYAFKQEKFLHSEILEGEGLVGRAWSEKDMIYITEIPEDYAYITSGLGGAKPRSILIMPLMTNDQVFGILELASFSEFKNYQIEFVKKVSENVAITISRVKINDRNRLILESSHMLSEQMRSQEEEMRQNMEVLLNSQEKLEKDVLSMKVQLSALNEAFSMIELDKEGNFVKVNDVIKRISGYTEREMLGKHYSLLLREKAENVNKDWQGILNGKIVKGEFIRYNKAGQKFWMFEIIYPFYNSAGKLEKIFAIGFDITRQKEQESILKSKVLDS